MVINTNIPSASAARTLEGSTNNLAKALAKLASGSRIVSPEDDAAGLAQSMKFSAEIKRVGASRVNVGNATSFSQTQDGFLSKIDSALRRMSELAVLATDQTKSTSDVTNYDKEFTELKSFITATSAKTFNTIGLFSASELADKDLNLDGDALDAVEDAFLKTQFDAITTSNTAWVADPASIANEGPLEGIIVDTVADLFTKAAHGLTTGAKVTFVSQTTGTIASFDTTSSVAYVKKVSDDTFNLYSDAALTTQLTEAVTAAGLVVQKAGNYDLLKTLRTDIADMAQEFEQFENSATTETDYANDTAKSWADTYDFWQTRIGNSWTGVREHTDTFTTALAASHELHVGNAAVLSDSLIENYKQLVADVQSYVTNKAAGIEVTDHSDSGTFQLKGADLSTITNAISSTVDTNTINAALTKTVAGDYVDRISTLINDLAASRAFVGANISRLGMVDSQLAVYGQNLASANSRIIDVDVATESANFAKQQILLQAGTAMLVQANTLPQSALQLLR